MFFLDQYVILLLHHDFYNMNKEANTCLASCRVLKDLQLFLEYTCNELECMFDYNELGERFNK